MRHKWEPTTAYPGNDPRNMLAPKMRRCAVCGQTQIREAIHDWMRIVGHRWEPPSRSCPGPRTAGPTRRLAEAQALCLEATFAGKREIAAAHRAQDKLSAAIAQARGE